MLKELNTYKLVVGESVTGNKGDVYQIINKETGVVEVETRIYPQSLEYLRQLQGAVDEMNNLAATKDDPNPKEAVVDITSTVKRIKPYKH